MAANQVIPPPPEGFVLDEPGAIPPPPAGFVLDKPREQAPTQRVGEFATGINKGIANILGLPVDTVTNAINLAIATYGTGRLAAGAKADAAPDLIEAPVGGSQWFQEQMGRVGLMPRPNPADWVGRITQRVGEEVGAAAVPMSRVSRAAEVAGPAAYSLVTGTGAGIGQEAGGQTGEAWGQLGTIAAPAGVALATRGTLRGGPRGQAVTQENIRAFEAAKVEPSVGQATENRFLQGGESLLGKTPGSGGVMAAKGEAQAEQMGARVAEVRESVSDKYGPEQAGRIVKGGIKKFVNEFNAKGGQLYDELDQHIPKSARVDVTNTRVALEELNADIPGAPNLSKWFKNAKIQGLETALKSDTETTAGAFSNLPAWEQARLNALPEVQRNAELAAMMDGRLPYESLKKLRTLVGKELTDHSLSSDIPRSKWKALYAALSKDLELAATDAGPEATKAYSRANTYWKAGANRIEFTLDDIANKVDPEDVYRSVLSGSKEGASTLRKVKRSLDPEEWGVVSATVIDRLGRSKPGQQGAEGDSFSPMTFLTNWNTLSKEAKTELFSMTGKERVRYDLDDIARAAEKIKNASKVLANPSGSAPAAANISAVTGVTVSAVTGQYALAGAILGGMALANLSARVLTSPKAAKWLAESTMLSPKEGEAHLKRLYNTLQKEKGDERADLEELWQAVKDVKLK